MTSWFDTHEVTNQPPPLVGYDAFSTNLPLVDAVERICGAHAIGPDSALSAVGRRTGSEQVLEWARTANANPPQLRTHDRYGNRIDVVDYHPAYHELMTAAVEQGLHAAPWADPEPYAHTRRAAAFTTWYQGDAGHTCPISMTYSAVPALRHEPSVAEVLEPLLTSAGYDPRNVPGSEKPGITFGMAMTEKQGGSDVRSNRTSATPIGAGGPAGEYRLTGHKWFCSAPMSDGFLTLAQAPGGLSCFWMPRWCPDGTRNPIRIQRLKDKLGDRSNASSEIEMLDTWARHGRRGRAWRAHHHRDGQPHASRLRARLRRRSCAAVSRRRPGTRTIAGRSTRRSTSSRSWRTCSPICASSPRPRPSRPCGSPPRSTVRTTITSSCSHVWLGTGGQVLDVQACTTARGRVPRVLRRRRLRRGVRHAPAVPPEPRQRHLGGFGQRHLPRRAAGDGPRTGVASTRSAASSSSPAVSTAATTTPSTASTGS